MKDWELQSKRLVTRPSLTHEYLPVSVLPFPSFELVWGSQRALNFATILDLHFLETSITMAAFAHHPLLSRHRATRWSVRVQNTHGKGGLGVLKAKLWAAEVDQHIKEFTVWKPEL